MPATKGPHSNFRSRTATDNTGALSRSDSNHEAQPSSAATLQTDDNVDADETMNPYEPATDGSTPPREHTFTKQLLHVNPHDVLLDAQPARTRSSSARRTQSGGVVADNSLTLQMHNVAESKKISSDFKKAGLGPRPVGGSEKLDTFSGVFVPTVLNVLSILMFLRFGFLLGQLGLFGMMGMLLASYLINFVTTFSLSAIASNGTVRGGGAYYLISRSRKFYPETKSSLRR